MTAERRCADGRDCSDALEQLEAFLDGELPAEQLDDIREHLASCYPCTGRASFEEQLRAIVRRDCVEDAPAGLVDRIERLLSQAPLDTDGAVLVDRGEAAEHG